MDAFEMIDRVTIILDRLADARGAEKCRLIIEGIQLLGEALRTLRQNGAEKEVANKQAEARAR